MNTKQRSTLVSVVLAVAAVALGGCTGTTPEAEGSTTLTVWNYEAADSAMGKAWRAAIEVFEAENPGITVDLIDKGYNTESKAQMKIALTGHDAPDVMEYNKGGADTGQLAAQGLLAPLNDAVEKYGWDEILNSESLQQLSRYEGGVAGAGDWYGIPNYGEYILWYYNKDYFAEHALAPPTSRTELVDLLADIKASGETPISSSAKEFPFSQTWFSLMLSSAPDDWTKSYQLFQGDVDWAADYWSEGTATAADWIESGYISSDSTGVNHEDMGVAFLSQESPLMTTGSWWYGRLESQAEFDWGTFAWPEQNVNLGSVGNLWVVPEKAANKELAYEFINVTMRPEIQNILGENGGLPVGGDPNSIADERIQQFTADFQQFASSDRLGFYPDLPIPGFLDFQVSEGQSLVNGSKTTEELLDGLKEFYEGGREKLIG